MTVEDKDQGTALVEKKQTLVELDRQYRDLLVELEREEEGEEQSQLIGHICQQLCEKVDAYGVVQERLKSECEYWKHQREQCQTAERVYKNVLEKLRERMRYVLTAYPDKSLQGDLYRFFLAKSKDSVVVNEELVPREYKVAQVTLVVDKEKIERDLRAGKQVPGATLVTDNYSLRTGRPRS